MKKVDIKIKVTRSPDYKVIHATGAFVMVNVAEGTLVFFVDKAMVEGSAELIKLSGIEREFVVEVKMSPHTFRELAELMMKHVEGFMGKGGDSSKLRM